MSGRCHGSRSNLCKKLQAALSLKCGDVNVVCSTRSVGGTSGILHVQELTPMMHHAQLHTVFLPHVAQAATRPTQITHQTTCHSLELKREKKRGLQSSQKVTTADYCSHWHGVLCIDVKKHRRCSHLLRRVCVEGMLAAQDVCVCLIQNDTICLLGPAANLPASCVVTVPCVAATGWIDEGAAARSGGSPRLKGNC